MSPKPSRPVFPPPKGDPKRRLAVELAINGFRRGAKFRALAVRRVFGAQRTSRLTP